MGNHDAIREGQELNEEPVAAGLTADAGRTPTVGDDATGMHPALPTLDDAGRSSDQVVCPFLRRDEAGRLVAPMSVAVEGQLCVAIGTPRPQSGAQQELVCLRVAHTDCPRHIRGTLAPRAEVPPRSTPAIPRATLAALLILVLSAGISFGFVVQRGGLELPVIGPTASDGGLAVARTPTPAGTGEPVSTEALTPGPETAEPSPEQSAAPTPAPSASPMPAASPSPSSSPSPTVAPTPKPTPRPTPRPTATPTSGRYALLTPCPDRKACYIYVVRSGDNLFSIAKYFGIPLSTIYAWNPKYASGTHLRVGDQVRMPPPSR